MVATAVARFRRAGSRGVVSWGRRASRSAAARRRAAALASTSSIGLPFFYRSVVALDARFHPNQVRTRRFPTSQEPKVT